MDCGITVVADGHDVLRCRPCTYLASPRTAKRTERVLEMVRLRSDEGLNNVEIAERLGVGTQMVAQELCRMRALGFSVPASPYRNADSRVEGKAKIDVEAERLLRALERRGIRPEVAA